MDIEIWDIIAARIHGEKLSRNEEDKLDIWLRESEDHVQYFSRLRNFYTELGEAGRGEALDVDSAFVRNQWGLSQKKAGNRKKNLRFLGYAASFVLLMGVAGLLLLTEPGKEPGKEQAGGEQIHSGSPRAVLTLASGETVALGEKTHQTFQGKAGTIRDTNNVLEYTVIDSVLPDEVQLNTLDIPRGGEYQLVLGDGTRVWLNSDTRLRFPVIFGKKERRIFLDGEAYFEVKKDTSRPFVVAVGEVNVTVLGTEFNVSSLGKEAGVYTTLVKGSVKVQNEKFSSILRPDEQAICKAGNKEIIVRKVDARLYTSWKDGYYTFEQQNLGDIMNTLSRWYDIQVFFGGQDVRELRFSGRLRRYENISNLLELIRLTNDVDFEIKGKTITVKNK